MRQCALDEAACSVLKASGFLRIWRFPSLRQKANALAPLPRALSHLLPLLFHFFRSLIAISKDSDVSN